jgi:hypothetical protein
MLNRTKEAKMNLYVNQGLKTKSMKATVSLPKQCTKRALSERAVQHFAGQFYC